MVITNELRIGKNIYFAQYGMEMDINERVLFDSVETALRNGEI